MNRLKNKTSLASVLVLLALFGSITWFPHAANAASKEQQVEWIIQGKPVDMENFEDTYGKVNPFRIRCSTAAVLQLLEGGFGAFLLIAAGIFLIVGVSFDIKMGIKGGVIVLGVITCSWLVRPMAEIMFGVDYSGVSDLVTDVNAKCFIRE